MRERYPGIRRALHDVLLGAVLITSVWTASSVADTAAPTPERIAWHKIPIGIALPVGDERLLHFPEPVKVGLPPQLQGRVRVQSIDGTLYARANAPFEPTRVMVQGVDTGQFYVLDLSAMTDGASNTAIAVYRPEDIHADKDDQADQSPTTASDIASRSITYGYATLTRFAAQQLYAPSRLLTPLPGVVRTPVPREAVPIVRGGAVKAEPLVAWRGGPYFITAVQLTNQSAAPVILDPRTLRGRWLTATFQHNRLHGAGSEADRTVVYLISDRPFADAW